MIEKIVTGLCVAVFVMLLLTLVFVWPVQLLWNELMPALFGCPEISFWQAWGLMILCSLLFKGNDTSKVSA